MAQLISHPLGKLQPRAELICAPRFKHCPNRRSHHALLLLLYTVPGRHTSAETSVALASRMRGAVAARLTLSIHTVWVSSLSSRPCPNDRTHCALLLLLYIADDMYTDFFSGRNIWGKIEHPWNIWEWSKHFHFRAEYLLKHEPVYMQHGLGGVGTGTGRGGARGRGRGPQRNLKVGFPTFSVPNPLFFGT